MDTLDSLDVLKLILLVLTLGSFVLAGAAVVADRAQMHLRAAILGVVVGCVLGIVWIFSLGLTQVPAGFVGVVTNFGKVQDTTLDPGIHWVPPLITTVTNVDTRVQPHEMKEIDAASKEQQAVKITGTLNYHVDARFASSLYQQVGLDFAGKVIDPALNDFIKTVTPDYPASEILGRRDEIRSRTMTALGANLARYHIIIDDIYIANIAFSPEYAQAIEAKQVAQQQVQTEQQVLAQKQIQAQQKVVDAQGTADAQVVAAKGQAQANTLVSESLDPEILQYLLIQKLGDNISVIYLPSGTGMILDPTKITTKP
jgi:regulator of protease activity HflC (stomatin/prohibitin superfamily)